jgi:hypothetical protein
MYLQFMHETIGSPESEAMMDETKSPKTMVGQVWSKLVVWGPRAMRSENLKSSLSESRVRFAHERCTYVAKRAMQAM